MKNLIVRRITILISIAIFVSSSLVVFLGMLFSEKITPELSYFQSLVISMIIVIPFVVILSYRILKRIVNPIRNVISVGISMIEGDFSVKVDDTMEGEIGLLGRTLNKLAVEFYRNVSQLYIEKKRLYQVLNSLEEGMIAVDENMIITHFNQVFLEIFNLSRDDILGVNVEEIPVLNEKLNELSQAIRGKCSIIKNGRQDDIVMRIIIASIEDEQNKSAGAVILFRDVTELEKLENMRRDYVANVSHELRSPLTSIRGLIEPLMDAIVTDEKDIKRYHEIIYQESLRLSRLVDDIMELSRLQTSDAVIEKTSVNLNSLVDMVYERYRLIDEDIKLVYNPVLLPKVNTNYDRIEQIMVILLDNAFKFTPKGGQIEISLLEREDYVLLAVNDTGSGIAEEDIEFVFDRFYKSDRSRTKKGTGLGLSIAKEILDIMGEKIWVKSKKDKGSSFEFTVHLKNK